MCTCVRMFTHVSMGVNMPIAHALLRWQVFDYCAQHGISVTAFSSFDGAVGASSAFGNPTLISIANAAGVSVPQVGMHMHAHALTVGALGLH